MSHLREGPGAARQCQRRFGSRNEGNLEGVIFVVVSEWEYSGVGGRGGRLVEKFRAALFLFTFTLSFPPLQSLYLVWFCVFCIYLFVFYSLRSFFLSLFIGFVFLLLCVNIFCIRRDSFYSESLSF